MERATPAKKHAWDSLYPSAATNDDDMTITHFNTVSNIPHRKHAKQSFHSCVLVCKFEMSRLDHRSEGMLFQHTVVAITPRYRNQVAIFPNKS